MAKTDLRRTGLGLDQTEWNGRVFADALQSYPNEEDYMTTALIENAGHVGQVLKEGISWKEAVDRVQRIINLHCDDILSKEERSREAHDKVSDIQAHWARILKG